jgi:hypothetical protein
MKKVCSVLFTNIQAWPLSAHTFSRSLTSVLRAVSMQSVMQSAPEWYQGSGDRYACITGRSLLGHKH